MTAACVFAGLLTWLAFRPEAVAEWLSESGPVERLTAASYALCTFAVWLARRPEDDWRSTLALSVLMAGFCMRELDWHRPLKQDFGIAVSPR